MTSCDHFTLRINSRIPRFFFFFFFSGILPSLQLALTVLFPGRHGLVTDIRPPAELPSCFSVLRIWPRPALLPEAWQASSSLGRGRVGTGQCHHLPFPCLVGLGFLLFRVLWAGLAEMLTSETLERPRVRSSLTAQSSSSGVLLVFILSLSVSLSLTLC